MNISNKIISDSSIYISLLFAFSMFLIAFLLSGNLLFYLIDIFILTITLLIRKDVYFYQNISYKIDFFRLLFLFHSLHSGLVYTIIISNISTILVFLMKNLFNNSEIIKELDKEKFSHLNIINKDIEKQKMNNYFLEYVFMFVSFFPIYFLFEYIPFWAQNGIFWFVLTFIGLWLIIEKILQRFYENIKMNNMNQYARKFFMNKEEKYIQFLIQITLNPIFFICIFYVFATHKLSIGIILSIFLLSFKDNTYISNQVLTFISLIVDLLEKKDRYTFDHSYRVALISYNISKQLNLDINDIDRIYKAAIIHDIGKIIIPDEILQKKGKLTKEEFEIIKLHVKELKNILQPIYTFIKEIVDIAELHHERLDGTGYPYGYRSSEIPLESRILAIADTFDALIIDRPYRPGFSFQKAISIIREEAEKNKLDMQISDIFIKTILQTEIIESVKRVKTMLKIYQGKIISNMISSLSDFIDEII
ncbi:MAG: HD domain-containing protein [Candidatus Calescibacterium sp.]|nr:HD domain-containing protein [Candidatus Calescibacterium sp.]MCX7972839.1 HD domain-containing protein [bacterium]MDW8195239.1 HD domain-containing protein [Candidatus Calescibacterium sp.]